MWAVSCDAARHQPDTAAQERHPTRECALEQVPRRQMRGQIGNAFNLEARAFCGGTELTCAADADVRRLLLEQNSFITQTLEQVTRFRCVDDECAAHLRHPCKLIEDAHQ